jgi:NADH-quinone oxidoreductase subunit J
MLEPTLQLLAQQAAVPPTPMAPAVILALCVVGGVGTVLLLPSRREAPLRKLGGVILLATGLIFGALLVRWAAGSAAAASRQTGVYFWIFAAIAIAGAVRVITHTPPVYSALYFVLTVFASAGLFLLLEAEFMAVALVVIYAGAILVTYVFVIMLAAEAASPRVVSDHDTVSRDPLLCSAIGFALMGVMLFVIFDKSQAVQKIAASGAVPIVSGATQLLGEFLFTDQLINLELAGLILTVAMVGAIVIVRRKVAHETIEGLYSEETGSVVLGPATPIDDDPHSIPVYGTTNPRQKAYPET